MYKYFTITKKVFPVVKYVVLLAHTACLCVSRKSIMQCETNLAPVAHSFVVSVLRHSLIIGRKNPLPKRFVYGLVLTKVEFSGFIDYFTRNASEEFCWTSKREV